MKKLVIKLLTVLIHIWSLLYNKQLSERCRQWRNSLYSMWICNFIGSVGENSEIYYPCKLWGGGERNIVIGDGTVVQSYCILGCWMEYAGDTYSPSIIIGNNCNIGEHTHITAINKITIGDGLLTGQYVYIGDNSHGGLSFEESGIPPIKRNLRSKGPVVIGNNVWVGDKVTILAGVTIGDNVIIGANSVVLHDVSSNCIVAGIPAKVIKELVSDNNQ